MQLFRFANPDFLYLLLLLPVISALWIIDTVRRRKALLKFGDKLLVDKLTPGRSVARPILKFIFELIALTLLIIASARPQFGSRIEEVKKQGIEVVIALDVSNSMLAEDIQPDRLTRAKQALERLIDNLTDDRIGLIVFAGDAYTQIPVTTDYISAKMFLSSINPDMVPKQGTAIGSAIDLGVRSFSPGEGKSRAIILITDGENHEDNPIASAENASKAGIVIHTIGIGSSQGVPVPQLVNGRKEFMKDQDGNTVITKLDEEVLKNIAATTGGSYVRASNTSIGLEEVFGEIKNMEKDELESKQFTDYNDQFQIFIAAAIFFLILNFLIMERKNPGLENLKFFRMKI